MGAYTDLVGPTLATAAIYLLAAISLNIIYAPSGVLNFGQGDLVAFGGLFGATVYSSGDWPLLPTVAVILLLGAGVGVITYYVGARRFMGRGGGFGWLLGTLGVAVIFESINAFVFGTQPVAFAPIAGLPREALHLGPFFITPSQLLIVVSAIVILVLVESALRLTRIGWALAAIAYDREAAAIRGIPVSLLTAGSFAVGAGLAAVAGFVIGPVTQASAFAGFGLLLKAFTAMVIGGVGRNGGAAVGALGLATAEAYLTLWIPIGYRDTIVLGLLLGILLMRPQGLFGTARMRTV